jgi:hypothetical protein
MNRDRIKGEDVRMHERIEFDQACRVVFEDGSEADARVVDLSLSGAGLTINPKPPIGSDITIGRMKGTVIRHIPNGVAVRFFSLQSSHNLITDRLRR